MVIPDESLLVMVLEVVEMVFVEVFLICLESLRLVTYQVGYIAPARVHEFPVTQFSSFSYPAHVKLNVWLAGPIHRFARVSQDPRSVDWFLAVSLRPPLASHHASWTHMTSSTILLLVCKSHLQ